MRHKADLHEVLLFLVSGAIGAVLAVIYVWTR